MVFVGVSEWLLIEGAVEALVTVDELDRLHMSTANVVSGGDAAAFRDAWAGCDAVYVVVVKWSTTCGILLH